MLVLSLFAILVHALSSVTISAPLNGTLLTGTATLRATTDAQAQNVTFYFTNSSGIYEIGTNNSAGTSFDVSWDTTSIGDGQYVITANATNTSGTTVSISNANISLDNTASSLQKQSPGNYSNAPSATVFNVTLTEANIDASKNVSVHYRRGAGGIVSKVLPCPGSSPYACALSVDLATDVGAGDGDVISFWFNTTDLANITAQDGNASSPYQVTIDTTSPTLNSLENPSNDTLTTNGTIIFGFKATDSNADSCTLYNNVSGSFTVNKSTTYSSGTAKNFSASSFPDGTFAWNVLCNDTAGNSAFYSTNYTLTVDSTNPIVNLRQPGDDTWSTNTSQVFIYNMTEANLASCVLYHNASGTWNATVLNSSVVSGGNVSVLLSLPELADIQWNVLCNDTLGNSAYASSNFTINIDATAPASLTFQGQTPDNLSSSSDTSPTINITFTELNPEACVLTFNNGTVQNFVMTRVGTSCNYTLPAQPDGDWNYSVVVNDSAGQTATSLTRFLTIDSNGLSVTLNTPANYTWYTTSNTVLFNYTPSDTHLASCVLYHNASGTLEANVSDSSVTTGNPENFSVTLTDGKEYLWNVLCNDTAGNTAFASTNFTLRLDSTAPVIAARSPAVGGYFTSSSALLFNISVTEYNINQSENATLYYRKNNTGSYTRVSLPCTGTSPNYVCSDTIDVSAKVVSAGEVLEYFFNVTDLAGNPGSNGTIAATLTSTLDDTAPSVSTLNNYANDSWVGSRTLIFGFTATEAVSPGTCVLYHNSSGTLSANLTTSYTSGSATNFSALTFGSDVALHWNVECNDTAGNVALASANNTLRIDAVDPASVTFQGQTPNNGSAQTGVNYTVNVTFTEANPDGCLLELRNGSTQNLSMTRSGSQCTLLVANQPEGNHNFTVYVNDSAGNLAASAARFVTVDTTAPVNITFQGQTPSNNSVTSDNTPTINISFTETNPGSCLVELNNGTVQNISMTRSGTECVATLPAQPDGNHNLTIYVNDTAGNIARSVIRLMTLDTTAPSAITYQGQTPSNDSSVSDDGWTVNVTFTESNAGSCLLELSNGSVQNLSMTRSGSECTYTIDGQAEGLHSYKVYVNDSVGNLNVSAIRYVQVDINSGAPQITNSSPSGTISDNTPLLSVTTNEAGVCKYDSADRSFDSMANLFNGTSTEHNVTLGALSDGSYTYYVRCNDSLGNAMTASSSISFTLDTTGNFNYTQDVSKNWNTLWLPPTTLLSSFGYNTSDPAVINISGFVSTSGGLGSNYNVIYYNTDGTDSGWRSFERGAWATSSLQYVNNTNDKPYWINMTAADRFEI